MKILSSKKYENLQAELELYKTAKEMLEKNLDELVDELEKKDNIYNTLKTETNKLIDTNREIADDYEICKKELKRLKTLLTKNKIQYKKEK